MIDVHAEFRGVWTFEELMAKETKSAPNSVFLMFLKHPEFILLPRAPRMSKIHKILHEHHTQ